MVDPGHKDILSDGTVQEYYYSEWSEHLEVAASPLPAVPAAMRKTTGLSTTSSIHLEWDKVAVANGAIKTSGYYLWMALNTQGSDEYVLIMNGTSRPE